MGSFLRRLRASALMQRSRSGSRASGGCVFGPSSLLSFRQQRFQPPPPQAGSLHEAGGARSRMWKGSHTWHTQTMVREALQRLGEEREWPGAHMRDHRPACEGRRSRIKGQGCIGRGGRD